MLANLKKTKLAVAVVAAAASVLTAPVVSAAERTELTIVPDFYPQLTRNFNPFLQNNLKTTLDFVYEPLVIFNQLDGNTPVMRLAKDYTISDDLKKVTFEIRDGVKWSDGTPFTAEDVAFTYNLIRENSALDLAGNAALITDVKVKGNSVEISLKEANSSAPFKLVQTHPVPKHIWSKIDKPEAFANENPVGSGPFTEIDTFTSNLYVQCENPNYWDADSIAIDCLRMPLINNNDGLLSKIVASELDWTSSFIPDIDAVYASVNKNHKYWPAPVGSAVNLLVNFEHPDAAKNEALTNLDFRRAMSTAIDRQSIIDIAFYGAGSPNHSAAGLAELYQSWSDKDTYEAAKKYNTYNVEFSKELLKKAGFKDTNGDGFVETPSGKSFELAIQTPSGWTDWNNTAQLAAENLADVGIKAKAVTPDFSVYNQEMAGGTFDVALTNYFTGPDPHQTWDTGFHSRFMAKEGNPRFAMHRFKNAEVDRLLEKFYSTADRSEQLEMAHRIEKILSDNQVVIPVLSAASTYQFNETRFTGWWDAENPKGRPMVWQGINERLLHILDLKPKS
ncbi:ABC transporter substrate-binding protein [Grimontia hollisae]|uniref:Oligopeptide-binding protein AppA n=1 Tax=Grimontia hollisae TaxID=673 RepID=A0A377HQE9_GRIHO|nr:ABC transporter substrate-binding protein [Grimontia hollisae]MDF2186454.1 ABC transporter substrate-binding protein [Grimontia hollisae]STO58417.1 Oligopeptide-binding protein AppA precursor [Grimontia hollisae]STQ76947.1 Oligopeptide-binding protein AppA precursor [Grimontia hollisae]